MTIIISLLLLATLLPQLTSTAHVNVGIVDGREAAPHSRPYMVSLQVFGHPLCGGFLISDEFVLTAAHCQKGLPMTVVVGAHNLTTTMDSVRINVKTQIPHPNYTGPPKPTRNDIMLLKLENKVELNNNIRPIALRNEGENVATDSVCSVAGWGRLGKAFDDTASKVLMEANMTTINPEECKRKWGTVYFVDSQMICAYGGGGSCRGDSGGPLVCGNTAVGVTSFGKRYHCNAPDRPNVYTKISAYIQWIRQETGNFK